MKRTIRDWVIRAAVAVWVFDRPVGVIYGWKTLFYMDLVALIGMVVAFEWGSPDRMSNEQQRTSNVSHR